MFLHVKISAKLVRLTLAFNFTNKFFCRLKGGNKMLRNLNSYIFFDISSNLGSSFLGDKTSEPSYVDVFAFQQKHGLAIPVAGRYYGSLANQGETLALAAALAAPAAPQVASAPLSQVDSWGVGWLGANDGAIPTAFWANTNAEALGPIFTALQAKDLSPTARALLRRFLALRLPRIDSLRDVRRLPGQVIVDEDAVGVKHVILVHVTDLADRRAHDGLVIELGLRGDLTREDHHVGFDHGLAGHTAGAVLRQAGVQHAVGDEIRDFVGMSFGY